MERSYEAAEAIDKATGHQFTRLRIDTLASDAQSDWEILGFRSVHDVGVFAAGGPSQFPTVLRLRELDTETPSLTIGGVEFMKLDRATLGQEWLNHTKVAGGTWVFLTSPSGTVGGWVAIGS